MIYIYRLANSTGARELVNGLLDIDVAARRWSRVRPRTPRPQDKIVCWGQEGPTRDRQATLNAVPIQNKFADALKLKEAGVPTIEVSREMPRAQATPIQPVDPALRLFQEAVRQAAEFAETRFMRTAPFQAGVGQVYRAIYDLDEALRVPAPVAVPLPLYEWLGRTNNHVGGGDLLRWVAPGGVMRADFFARKENIVEEFRIHSFLGKSIRAGKKVPREGFFNPQEPSERQPAYHSWIRSFDAGWRIQYDGFESPREMREVAHRAVKALGLDFGAVDIGRLQNGSYIVLEVNRAPGLEGGTVVAYANAIAKWARGEE